MQPVRSAFVASMPQRGDTIAAPGTARGNGRRALIRPEGARQGELRGRSRGDPGHAHVAISCTCVASARECSCVARISPRECSCVARISPLIPQSWHRPPIHPLAKSARIAKAGWAGSDLLQRTSCTCNQPRLSLLPLCPNGATRLQPRAPPGGTDAARSFALKGRDKGDLGTIASRGVSASVRTWKLLPQVSPRRNA